MLLGINTSEPTAYLCLYDDSGKLVAEKNWEAGRELAKGLLGHIDLFLREQDKTFKDLKGLFAFRGPGSFTGLRIGLTVLNTIVYSEDLAVVGASGDEWAEESVRALLSGKNDRVVLPLYGAEARITKPKK